MIIVLSKKSLVFSGPVSFHKIIDTNSFKSKSAFYLSSKQDVILRQPQTNNHGPTHNVIIAKSSSYICTF